MHRSFLGTLWKQKRFILSFLFGLLVSGHGTVSVGHPKCPIKLGAYHEIDAEHRGAFHGSEDVFSPEPTVPVRSQKSLSGFRETILSAENHFCPMPFSEDTSKYGSRSPAASSMDRSPRTCLGVLGGRCLVRIQGSRKKDPEDYKRVFVWEGLVRLVVS